MTYLLIAAFALIATYIILMQASTTLRRRKLIKLYKLAVKQSLNRPDEVNHGQRDWSHSGRT